MNIIGLQIAIKIYLSYRKNIRVYSEIVLYSSLLWKKCNAKFLTLVTIKNASYHGDNCY